MDELTKKLTDLIRWCQDNKHSAQRMAEEIIDELGLESEAAYAPVSVFEFDALGLPVFDERFVNEVQKAHFEWVDQQRYVTPWKEVPGGRRDRYDVGDEFGAPSGASGRLQ